jgi:hypothetical protein
MGFDELSRDRRRTGGGFELWMRNTVSRASAGLVTNVSQFLPVIAVAPTAMARRGLGRSRRTRQYGLHCLSGADAHARLLRDAQMPFGIAKAAARNRTSGPHLVRPSGNAHH